ncbi:hypothetical protein A2W24_06050 [Microgenomates group bacterium RBG_16_45_19]|nr:MAG: hypothetical protein A2W24_06050 [Microgenomates group bacterium RBG_16_45_19]
MELVVLSPLTSSLKLLKLLGYTPRHLVPVPPEAIYTLDPADFGQEILKDYLAQGRTAYHRAYLLGLTTVLVYRQRRLKPPHYKMDALNLLKLFSGHTFSIMTYWATKHPRYQAITQGSAETKITLKAIQNSVLTGYVNDHDVVKSPLILDPTDPQVFTLIQQIEGSYANFLYQLPIEKIDLSDLK